jgi:hypothetical protein
VGLVELLRWYGLKDDWVPLMSWANRVKRTGDPGASTQGFLLSGYHMGPTKKPMPWRCVAGRGANAGEDSCMSPGGLPAPLFAVATELTCSKLCKRLVFQLKLSSPWDCGAMVDEGLEKAKNCFIKDNISGDVDMAVIHIKAFVPLMK